MQYYSKNKNQVLSELESGVEGLCSHVVQKRTSSGKKNRLETEKKQKPFFKFMAQFKDIMVIVLIISAILSISISIFSKEYQNLFEGGIILFIVILNATFGFVQENKADNALESLKKQTLPYCKVIRDGKVQTIKAEDLVVGDVVLLASGNIVPADVRLIETFNFKVNESALTGESTTIEKNADIVLKDSTPLAERRNMAYSGSVVTYGRAKGVVTDIGSDTEMGKIATMISGGKKELTPLQKSLNKIGKIISISVIIIAIIIFAVEMIVPSSPKILEAFLTAVALAVAAIPESLPASITIIMAIGVQKLANRNAIIKRLHAVETLGSCSVICSDKTGTLTQNKMVVKNLFYNNKMIVKSTSNTNLSLHFKEIINCMTLCNDSEVDENNFVGDPTETALLRFAIDNEYNVKNIIEHNKRIFEIPFDSDRKLMTTVNSTTDGLMCYTKGAFDVLIKKCSKIMCNGKVENLDQEKLKEIEEASSKMTENALRVLCLAYKPLSNNFKENELECDLIFLGLVGMFDPPREETYSAIKKCFEAGLKPVMITGDHASTAFAIAKEIGLAKDKSQVITGEELSKIDDKKLASVINRYVVFARVTPYHKVRIVNAFKANGKIVAMTGDGVNDAPSLKIADIGIGMGISGTDVTKDVADMIISDDNFATIIVAVEEGRKIYTNIQKTIQFLLSTNAVEVFTLFLMSLFLPNYTFLLPSQLLFINFITDTLPAISLGLEPAEKDIMKRPPRNSSTNIISLDIWLKILYQAGIQIVIVMGIYCLGLKLYSPVVASTMSFLCINIMQLLHAINLKFNGSIFNKNLFKNKLFNLSFIISVLLIVMVAFIPQVSTMFGIVNLDLHQWLIVLCSSFSIIPFVEFTKYFSKKIKR